MNMKLNLCKSIALAAAMFCAGTLAAQGIPSLFGGSRKHNSNRSADIPTTVTAMTMDIDMGRNIATLLGNVFVDDQDMTIRCNKMLIFFEDKKKDAPAKKSDDAAKNAEAPAAQPKKEDDKNDADTAGGKKPVRIECYGDVIITARQKDNNDPDKKEQKATAGKAVYDLVKDEITLTESPVIHNGIDSDVKGNKILFIVQEERMLVFQGEATGTNLMSGDEKKDEKK